MPVLRLDWDGVPVNLAVYAAKDERAALKASAAGPPDRAGEPRRGVRPARRGCTKALRRRGDRRRRPHSRSPPGSTSASNSAPEAPDPAAVSALTRADLPELAGGRATLERWRGKVIVVNFWASWCPPCREEIPGLVRIQQKFAANGLQVVGIAVDSVDKSRQAAAQMGISYPVLVAGVEVIDVTRRLGNRAGGLPYTLDPRPERDDRRDPPRPPLRGAAEANHHAFARVKRRSSANWTANG